jgi:hypothetical protein
METNWDYAEYTGCHTDDEDCAYEVAQLENETFWAALEIIFSEDGLKRIIYSIDEQHANRLADALALIRSGALMLAFDGKVRPRWRGAEITRVDSDVEFIEIAFRPGWWRVFVEPCKLCGDDDEDLEDERAKIVPLISSLYAERERRKGVMISRAVGMARKYLWKHAALSDDAVDILTDLETKNYTVNVDRFYEKRLLVGGWHIGHVSINRHIQPTCLAVDAGFYIMYPIVDGFDVEIVSTGRRDERWRRARDRVERRLLTARTAEAL